MNTIKKIIHHQKALQIGNTKLTIRTSKDRYRLKINIVEDKNRNKKIKQEALYRLDGERPELLFDRKKIRDYNEGRRLKSYRPPNDTLTFHARRDELSYPYLEDIVNSLKKFHFLDIEGQSRLMIRTGPRESVLPLKIFSSQSSENYLRIKNKQKSEIIADLNSLGFPISKLSVRYEIFEGLKTPVLLFNEKGVSGMYDITRASSALVKIVFLIICMHLIEKNSCILVDNVGDGLDYKRSVEIVNLLKKFKDDRQIILSTNNEILLNQTDIRNWNILHRKGHVVKAFNYENSKEILEKFAKTGLSNYEYFQDDYFLPSEK